MRLAGRARHAISLPALAWFSESASRVVLSVAPDRVDDVRRRAPAAAGVPAADVWAPPAATAWSSADAFDVALADATDAWRDAIPRARRQSVDGLTASTPAARASSQCRGILER